MQKIIHFPVMCSNILRHITSRNYLRHPRISDCTFGLGGHSIEFLQKIPTCKILAYQIDPTVIDHFKFHYQSMLVSQQKNRLTIKNENFTNIKNEEKQTFDIILVDLGFNSLHIKTNRGFSWLRDEPLSMLYSESNRQKAADFVNNASIIQLKDILQKYGELRNAVTVATAIVAARPILTTWQLRDAVVGCFQDHKTRRIAQVFQAVRICVNQQMQNLNTLCSAVENVLAPQGLFLAITFHSVERDIIHRHFNDKEKKFKKIKTQLPSKPEIITNSKSHSAKLLIVQKKK